MPTPTPEVCHKLLWHRLGALKTILFYIHCSMICGILYECSKVSDFFYLRMNKWLKWHFENWFWRWRIETFLIYAWSRHFLKYWGSIKIKGLTIDIVRGESSIKVYQFRMVLNKIWKQKVCYFGSILVLFDWLWIKINWNSVPIYFKNNMASERSHSGLEN